MAHRLTVNRQCTEERGCEEDTLHTLYANGAGITVAAVARPGR